MKPVSVGDPPWTYMLSRPHLPPGMFAFGRGTVWVHESRDCLHFGRQCRPLNKLLSTERTVIEHGIGGCVPHPASCAQTRMLARVGAYLSVPPLYP